MPEEITYRTARPEDAEQILKIYAPFVEHTTVTFDFERLMNCLGAMRDESVRAVNNPYATHDSRLAWYYCQLGAYDLAYQVGWISSDEHRRLYDELKHLAPID